MPEEKKEVGKESETKEEVKETPKVEEKPKEEPKPKVDMKETVADVLETPKGSATIELDKYVAMKKDNDSLRKSIKDLERKINEGSPKAELSADLEDIAKEFPDINPKFLSMLDKMVDNRAAKKADEKLRPIAEKELQEKQDRQFTKHLESVLEEMPEYKDIVNPKVIKRLALDPENADKTFPELIEETYSNAISGKRTIETTKPGGGKEPEPLNYEKATRDPEYFKEVMKNPELKKQYNEKMLQSGF